MQYPNITQYIQAIQEPESFKTFKDGIKPVMNGTEPVFATGNFAVVFKMEYQEKFYALKCFLKDSPEREFRQQKIAEYIKNNPSPYFVEYHYLPDELWVDVDGGHEYPVNWMEWIEAPTLGNEIKKLCYKEDYHGLEILGYYFRDFALWLLKQNFAHGDLKPDNLLVKPNGEYLMIDYDGMYIPEFEGLKAIELGSKSYQHPKRTEETYNKHIDDFSILSIYISLLALSQNPDLYEEFNDGQNIIFESDDYIDYRNSKCFNKIKEISMISELFHEFKIILNSEDIRIGNLEQLLKESHGIYKYNLNKLDFSNEYHNTIFRKLFFDVLNAELEKHYQLNPVWARSVLKVIENPAIKRLFVNNVNFIAPKKIPNDKFYKYFEENFANGFEQNLVNVTNNLILLNDITKQKKFIVAKISGIWDDLWGLSYYIVKFDLNLDFLELLTNVKFLYIFQNTSNLDSLSAMPKLKFLYLKNKNADIGGISRIKNLKTLILDLEEKNIDLSAISGMTSLNKLIINNYWVSSDLKADLFFLKKLKKLKKLTINIKDDDYKTMKITLDNVPRLKNLKELRIGNNIADLEPLLGFRNLKKLAINYNEEDLSKLTIFKKLKCLDLCRDFLSFEPLASLTQLRKLKISGKMPELLALQAMVNLKYLKIKPLNGYHAQVYCPDNLKKIYLSNIELSTLYDLKNLKELRLENYTGVFDLLPISELKSLRKLTIKNMHSRVILSPIAHLDNLHYLVLRWVSKDEIDGLKNKIDEIRRNGGIVKIKYEDYPQL
jgi:serine/threonine protein kinase